MLAARPAVRSLAASKIRELFNAGIGRADILSAPAENEVFVNIGALNGKIATLEGQLKDLEGELAKLKAQPR